MMSRNCRHCSERRRTNNRSVRLAPSPKQLLIGKPGASGLSRIWRALGFSLAGLKAAYQNEAAFRQETWIAGVLIPAAFFWCARQDALTWRWKSLID